MSIRVVVNGSLGKMGQEVIKTLSNTPGLHVVGAIDKDDNLAAVIADLRPDVVVDFTTATAAYTNACQIIAGNARPVIGTSGLLPLQIQELSQRCAEKKLGGLIAPNFCIGAILMMQFSKECARYFSQVEIIELHHAEKADAPSGTAMRTAEMITENQQMIPNTTSKEKFPGVRGGLYQNIPIHSVRLPGLLAHQEVIFGSAGETLTIRQDTYSRASFMPGVRLACQKVMGLEHLVVGLEHIL